MSSDELPANFDAELYRARYRDVRGFDDADLVRHFRTAGASEGRAGSAVSSRPAFIDLIRGVVGSILEIGPFANPMLRGANVKYFDVLSTDDLKRRAREHKLNPKNCPHIEYVSTIGDLGVVTEQFDAVASSHVIEHQPDLIRHLASVAKLLKTGGRYFLAIPDKRFCFDHFIAPSSIADVVDAHARQMRVHSVASIIEHRALTTHNDARRHWNDDHGEPIYRSSPTAIRQALNVRRDPDAYIDTHAWQFTPDSFQEIMGILFTLGMSALRVARVYDTVRDSFEFYAILENTGDAASEPALPAGFDPAQYLLANPDVAGAGADPALHYLNFGYREGRKLRP